jgi:hypothetical protein
MCKGLYEENGRLILEGRKERREKNFINPPFSSHF